MNEKAKEQRNAYMREWRKKNEEKVKAAQERYWEKKSKKILGGNANVKKL